MRAARIARALWIVWAIVVWNVVFDHTIVVAGRHYIGAADQAMTVAAGALPRYENMDAWMRPAIWRGLVLATAAASVILATGFFLARTARFRRGEVPSCA